MYNNYMEKKFFEAVNLCFSHYRKPLCIKDASFSINQNDKILILASAEMGKTTLLSVLSSFETSYFGRINLNGKELREIEDSKKNFSFLPTCPVLLNNKTILQNLMLLSQNTKKDDIKNNDSFDSSKIIDKYKKISSILNIKDSQIDKKIKSLTLLQKRLVSIIRSEIKAPTILFLDNQFKDLNQEDTGKMKEVYSYLICSNSKTIFFAIDDKTFVSEKDFFYKLPISKVLYLVDSRLFEYKNLKEFETNISNLNQILFLGNYYEIRGYIIKQENDFYFLLDDKSFFKFNNGFYDILGKLNLKNYENEDAVLISKIKVDEKLLTENNFNDYLNSSQFMLFSRIDGSRLI